MENCNLTCAWRHMCEVVILVDHSVIPVGLPGRRAMLAHAALTWGCSWLLSSHRKMKWTKLGSCWLTSGKSETCVNFFTETCLHRNIRIKLLHWTTGVPRQPGRRTLRLLHWCLLFKHSQSCQTMSNSYCEHADHNIIATSVYIHSRIWKKMQSIFSWVYRPTCKCIFEYNSLYGYFYFIFFITSYSIPNWITSYICSVCVVQNRLQTSFCCAAKCSRTNKFPWVLELDLWTTASVKYLAQLLVHFNLTCCFPWICHSIYHICIWYKHNTTRWIVSFWSVNCPDKKTNRVSWNWHRRPLQHNRSCDLKCSM